MISDERDDIDEQDLIPPAPLGGAAANSAEGKKNAPRPSAAEMKLRTALVANLLVNQNMKRAELIEFMHTDQKILARFGYIPDRTIDRLIAKASEIIDEAALFDVTRERAKAKMRFEDLYRRAINKGQVGTASRIQARINRMLGLDAALKLGLGQDPNAPPLPTGGGNIIVVVQEARE